MKSVILASVAAALLAAVSIPANAGVKLGTLSCDVDPGVGILIGSSKGVDCQFVDTKGNVAHYTGNITKLGVDVGFTSGSRIIWGVVAPSWDAKHSLEGTYVGANAEATLGVGLGANVLIGGVKKSITLQPVSVQGQAGLNVAVAAASLTLKPAH